MLIVDDDALVRRYVRRVLQAAGFRIVGEATDGAEALAMIEILNPRVVVMDARMPVMDGLIATRYVSSLFPNTKVVAYTSDEALGSQMVQAGAVALIQKSAAGPLAELLTTAMK